MMLECGFVLSLLGKGYVTFFAKGTVQHEARWTQQDLFAPSSWPRMFL